MTSSPNKEPARDSETSKTQPQSSNVTNNKDTGGGATIGGNVDAGGDVIGSDQHIQGDYVRGDVHHHHYYVNDENSGRQSPDPSAPRLPDEWAGHDNPPGEHIEDESEDNLASPPAIESPYGTMMPESPFYIQRDADGTCSQTFGSDNPFTLYVQSPRQVGKSSLMQRMAHYARLSADSKIAFVDFEKFTQEQLGDLEEFLIELCLMIGDELGVEEEIDSYFASKRRSNLVKCSNYLSKHIVPAVQGPIVLAMDEVERVLGAPFQDDFFGMLRTWHNDRARDPNFARISLFLSSSTEPELFIDNPNRSPFNVAQPVTLHDFSQSEVAQLNQLHDSPLSVEQVEQLMTLLDGHPFLTRLALYLITMQQTAFDTLLTQSTDDDGPFGDHLSRFWRRLAETPDLQASLRQIQRTQQHPIDRNLEKLKGAGLVKRAEGKVVMRNDLYARYFEERMNG